ncbi:AcrR family transcriptional regulator [Anaerosolibacter carboniphilus]|uniref:AcrR family transcriptional regulator n=1 Tax=Anaerosolibacter carboniphilus TaxID=1417629 RepID=A0A841KLF3_9FIRM|nr:TetR/AcrR family transcriptional regulator [Anaerosolibacter carboniphilus]MBB6214277.1 AcrR family transcriptional regulator [Anaerosolibacter carboniphilus]
MKKTMRKMNKRQLQAMDTHQRIHKTALSLMEKYGYDNVTIRDICEAAGVATGTFYTYFKAKSDIFSSMYVEADQYFATHVAANLSQGSATDQIIEFFIEYAKYNEDSGLDRMKLLYNPENKWFITKGRQMPEVLKNILLSGQKKGELVDTISAEQMTEWLFIAARGIVYDWCLHDASYDQQAFMKEYFGVFLNALVKKDSL